MSQNMPYVLGIVIHCYEFWSAAQNQKANSLFLDSEEDPESLCHEGTLPKQ